MYLQQQIGPLTTSGYIFGSTNATITHIGIEAGQYNISDNITSGEEGTIASFTVNNNYINNGNTIYIASGDILEYDNLNIVGTVAITPHQTDNGDAIITIGYEINNEE